MTTNRVMRYSPLVVDRCWPVLSVNCMLHTTYVYVKYNVMDPGQPFAINGAVQYV